MGSACPSRSAWLALCAHGCNARVPGAPIGPALAGPGGADLATRVAEVAHKIHVASPRARRRHGIADELAILRQRLGAAGADGRLSQNAVDRLLSACDRLGGALAPCMPCGIHRDFYADQVIADGARLWVIDFDLYCVGDPALDAGNFAGHITEQACASSAIPERWPAQPALETRAAELEGQAMLPRIHAYAALTLVRHVEFERRPRPARPSDRRAARPRRGAREVSDRRAGVILRRGSRLGRIVGRSCVRRAGGSCWRSSRS